MALRKHRWALVLGCLLLLAATVQSQVFVVGEKTATDQLSTQFTTTNLPLPTAPMTERGRRELIRMLVAEQGFAHCALPMGAGLTLRANGPLEPSAAAYRELIYKKGQSAAPGDRVVVTALTVKGDRIVLDPLSPNSSMQDLVQMGGDTPTTQLYLRPGAYDLRFTGEGGRQLYRQTITVVTSGSNATDGPAVSTSSSARLRSSLLSLPSFSCFFR